LRKEEPRIRCESIGTGEFAFNVAASADSIAVVALGDFSNAEVQRSRIVAT
jgi:hypothetical protein